MDSIIARPVVARARLYDLVESTADLELEIEEFTDLVASWDVQKRPSENDSDPQQPDEIGPPRPTGQGSVQRSKLVVGWREPLQHLLRVGGEFYSQEQRER